MLKSVLSISVLILIFLPSVVLAESLVEKLTACAQVQDSLVRLVCYDKLVKSDLSTHKKAKELESKEAVVEPFIVIEKKPLLLVVDKTEHKKDNFGQEHLVKEDNNEDSFEQAIFTIVSVKKDARDNLRLVFQNGQTWKQTGGTPLNLKNKERVKISKGMLGAFYLSKVDRNKTIKVRRIK